MNYGNGGYSKLRKVLTSVESKVDGEEYRAYILNYNEARRRMLTSIQECPTLTSAAADCLKPTEFDWSYPLDFSAVDSSYTYTSITGDEHNRHEAQVFDITGDGKTDLLYVKGGYWRVKPAGSASAVSLTNIGDNDTQRPYALNIDFNGDGVRDLLVADGEDKSWYINYYEKLLLKWDSQYNVEKIYKKKSRFSNFLPFLIDEIGMKNKITNKNLDIEYRFEALFTNIKNYNDPKALYYLCGTCLFIN